MTTRNYTQHTILLKSPSKSCVLVFIINILYKLFMYCFLAGFSGQRKLCCEIIIAQLLPISRIYNIRYTYSSCTLTSLLQFTWRYSLSSHERSTFQNYIVYHIRILNVIIFCVLLWIKCYENFVFLVGSLLPYSKAMDNLDKSVMY